MSNVADLFIQALAQVGVKRVYGVVGDSLNAVTEALRQHGGIAWVHTRHEETAAFAAGAEAHLTGSLNHGSMANALPQAIGAQATYPRRQVVSFSGDGGFTMLMGDLLTLVQYKLPVKVVVLNNGTLGFVEMEMEAAGFLETGVELVNPNFAAMASGAGLFAKRVEDPADLAGALRELFAHDGPALLDVVTARHELAMPPKIGIGQATGFGLWVAKAVINGRGSEVVDLARTNLFR